MQSSCSGCMERLLCGENHNDDNNENDDNGVGGYNGENQNEDRQQ
ncbi:hypothetical protein L195_g058174 [Trifolium pratense]|uniref:Uncharacterized protein n=1 Tax=Trifolium pratense TaxID=57577 RepID=A0A2K3JQQ9_TRIPR|nr:hypothetical protein L195_g058174 [Trifolium pratense]